MKLLHVTTTMNPQAGGVCQAVRTTITGLTELGVQNEVVCLDAHNVSFLDDSAYPVHALGPGSRAWCYSKKLIPWLIENCLRFDAVILHGLWQYPGYALQKTIKSLKAKHKQSCVPKLLVMPHGMLDPYFQEAKGRKLKAIRNTVYWRFIESAVVNEADVLLFTCEEERRLAHKPFTPYRPKEEAVIGLGVEEPLDYSESLKEAFLENCPGLNENNYILFLSRIHEKKGVANLIKAYAAVLEKRLASNLPAGNVAKDDVSACGVPKLVIAGPGLESAYGQKIRQLVAASERLQNAVFLIGMQTGAAKWGAFYGCEAFVLPSHQENFGIAVVEALACSKPVLISNQINIWREIEESGGALVSSDTVEGIEASLTNWMTLKDEQKRTMGRKAHTAYQKYFTIYAAAQSLLEAAG